MPEVKLPSIAVVAIGAALGVIVALNEQVFQFGPPWQTGITVLVTLAGALGISAISGPAFQAVIHLPQATCAVIASALGVLQLVLAQAAIGSALATVLHVVITIGATLGFGPGLSRKARRLLLAVGAGHPIGPDRGRLP